MPETTLQFGNRLLAEAAMMPPGDAMRFLFDHYRSAGCESQDGLVLALIGQVTTANARRESQAMTRSISSPALVTS